LVKIPLWSHKEGRMETHGMGKGTRKGL
jgi:hypothetical protein